MAKPAGWGLLGLVGFLDCASKFVRASDLQFAAHHVHATIAIPRSSYHDAAAVSGAAALRALYSGELVEIQLADVFGRHEFPRYLYALFVSGQSATGSDENKTQEGRLQGMRRRGYDAVLLGGTQFMRRNSLAMSLDTPAVKTPAYGRGFLFVIF
ncbi:hypothetical protein ACL00O_05995 [Aeromonas sanarellii]|uniref:hypothetical protein n=1 Tax=Aeromonas sanarellii TaxID=633415 RepID=UPI0039A3B532